MLINKTSKRYLVLIGFILLSHLGLMGTTINWDGGGGDTDWTNALNWAGDVIPVSSDTARLNTNGDNVVISSAAQSLGGVSVDGNSSGAKTMALTISSGGSLTAGSLSLEDRTSSLTISGGSLILDSGLNSGQAYWGHRQDSGVTATFNMTSGSLTSNKRTNFGSSGSVSWSMSGGTYVHNDARWNITALEGTTINLSGGSWTMNNSDFGVVGESSDWTFNISGNVSVYGQQQNTSNPFLKWVELLLQALEL
jgi:hypothetical protein